MNPVPLLLPIASLGLLSLPAGAAMVAYYEFDNAGNPFEDSSGNGNNLIAAAGPGGPTWGATNGFNNSGAYLFGGDGDRVISPVDINVSAMPQMTWGAWVRTDDLNTGLRKVMGHDNGAWDRTIGLDNRQDGILRYTSFNGSAAPSTQLTPPGPANTTDWTFLAASYDSTTSQMTFYIDLDSVSTADALGVSTGTANFGTGFTTFSIGSIRPDIGNEGWNGAIDQVFVFDEILTEAQLTAIRNQGFVPEPSVSAYALLIGAGILLRRRRRRR